MHLVQVRRDDRLVLSTALVLDQDVSGRRTTHLRLQLATTTDRGVILEFCDPAAFRLLATAARSLLATYNGHVSAAERLPVPPPPPRSAPPRRPDRPTPLSFGA